jgi:hypothetical protein
MSNYRYTTDLIDAALFNSNETTDGTSEFEVKALEYLNRAYRSVILGGDEFVETQEQDWWWLRKSAYLITTTPEEGEITVTQLSTAASFTVAPTTSMAGRHLRTIDTDIYKIATHTAGQTACTLDAPYTGASGATAYTAFQLDYDLAADFLKPLDPMKCYRAGDGGEYRIFGIDNDVMEKGWPLSQINSGSPSYYTHRDENTIRFNHYASNPMRIDYDYIFLPEDLTAAANEEPVLPLINRKVLADITATFILMDKDDNKASSMSMVAKKGIEAMVKANRSKWARTGKPGHIYARMGKRGSQGLQSLRTIQEVR